jgi:hypothetical protein
MYLPFREFLLCQTNLFMLSTTLSAYHKRSPTASPTM